MNDSSDSMAWCRLLQTQRLQQLRVEGQKALGLTWAWDSGFVARAAALRAAGWLPEHSTAVGAALGSGLRVRCSDYILPSAVQMRHVVCLEVQI
jgi:hypothetical protein